jgi:signal transduction histidine kinase
MGELSNFPRRQNCCRCQDASTSVAPTLRPPGAAPVKRPHMSAPCSIFAHDDWLAHVSHQLRSPLHAILGLTQVMQNDAQLPAAAQRNLRLMRKAGEQLMALVDDVLTLSRIEHGQARPPCTPVLVAPLLKSCLDLVAPLAQVRGLRIVLGGNSQALTVLADKRSLQQVLMNLLSNAVKYNRENGVLTVAVKSDAHEVALCISDEGPGLSPVQRERLFRPFDRLGAEDSSIPGTGLGLVICKQLTEAMQGRLEVHQSSEGGCRFEVWLPANATCNPAWLPSVAISADQSSPAVC